MAEAHAAEITHCAALAGALGMHALLFHAGTARAARMKHMRHAPLTASAFQPACLRRTNPNAVQTPLSSTDIAARIPAHAHTLRNACQTGASLAIARQIALHQADTAPMMQDAAQAQDATCRQAHASPAL
jgi:hypothetical protein